MNEYMIITFLSGVITGVLICILMLRKKDNE